MSSLEERIMEDVKLLNGGLSEKEIERTMLRLQNRLRVLRKDFYNPLIGTFIYF